MARGQERTITGGQIDPYVQQSIQQGKGQAENRLLSVMQENAQTQRSRESNATQAGIASSQMANQRQMQAADLAAQDKRAAEAEKAHRDDMQYKQIYDKAYLKLHTDIEKNRLNWDKAKYDKDIKRADEAANIQRQYDIISKVMELRTTKNTLNAVLSQTKMGAMVKTARQKNATVLARKMEEDGMVEATYHRSIESISQTIQDMLSSAGYDSSKMLEFGNSPVLAAQKEVSRLKANIDIFELDDRSISKIEDKIASGEIKVTDLRAARAGIDAAISTLDNLDKISFPAKDSIAGKTNKEFLMWQRNKLHELKANLTGLSSSTRKSNQDPNITVGSVLRKAFDPIDGGGLKEITDELLDRGIDYEQMYDELTKAVDPFIPFTLPDIPGMEWHPKVLESFNGLNSAITGIAQEQEQEILE